MQKKPLPELLEALEQELRRLGYTEATLKFYRRRWQMLREFAKSRGVLYSVNNSESTSLATL